MLEYTIDTGKIIKIIVKMGEFMSQITKKALSEALKKRMLTTPLSKITVKDVAEECGVNRRTLYYYFHDVYELLEWTFKTEFNEILGKNKTYTTWQKGFLEILNYFYTNKKIVFNIYNSVDKDRFEKEILDELNYPILEVVKELSKEMNVDEEGKKYVAKFYNIAFVGLTIDWIRSNMVENPEEIIRNLNKIISGDIYRALLKYEHDGEPISF